MLPPFHTKHTGNMRQRYEQFENFSVLACIHWKLSSGMVQAPSDKKHGTHETATSAVHLMDSVLFRFNFVLSAFDTTGRQALHKELLTEDKDHHHRDQCQHRHGKHIAPLGELMLTEEARNRNGQCTLCIVIDDGVRPGILLPGRQEIENADRRNRGRSQRHRDLHRQSRPLP